MFTTSLPSIFAITDCSISWTAFFRISSSKPAF